MDRKLLKIGLPFATLVVSILVAVVLVKSRPMVETRPADVTAPLIRIMTVRPENLQLTVYSQGSVMPRTQSTLASEVPGRVIHVSQAFAAGGFFEKGEVLVRLDPRNAELAVTRSKAEVARAEMALKIEEEEAKVALQEWTRLGEGAPTALTSRQPQLVQAQTGLAAAGAALQQAELNLIRTEIRAPFAGRVRIKNVDVGQYVTPGSPLATVYAVDYAEVRLPIPDDQLAYLDVPLHFRGERSSVQSPDVVLEADFAGQRYQWTGRVVRLEGEIDPQSRMVHAIARVKNPYGRGSDPNRPPLSVGMFVEAAIAGHAIEGVIVIPRVTIRGRDRVLVVDDENRLRFRTVKILRLEPNRAIIRAGVRDGDRICLSPLEAPVDGMLVRILQEEQPEPSMMDREGVGQ